MCRNEEQQQEEQHEEHEEHEEQGTQSAGEAVSTSVSNQNHQPELISSSSSLSFQPLRPWPQDTSSWQKWTYQYMNPILRQSFVRKRPLTHNDIYSVPDRLASRHLRRTFWQEYHKQLQQQQQQNRSNNDNNNDNNNNNNNKNTQKEQERALFWTLWKLAAPTFVPAGLCQFVSIVAQVTTPLLVRFVLQRIEQQQQQQNDYYSSSSSLSLIRVPVWPSLAILVTLLIYGLTNHRQRHLALQAAMALRATLLTVLYQRVLTLTTAQGSTSSTTSTTEWNTARVTNLVAVDAQKVYEVAQEGHLLWALPLAIVLVTVCLMAIMGPVTLVGIFVLTALVPLVQGITATLFRLRTRRVACTDARLGLTTALLQGMQVCKLHHYETQYQQAISAVRRDELHWLTRESAVWATTLSVSKLSAAYAAAATFAVHVLVQGNILTAAQSFSVFLLFAALRFPINYAGRFMGRWAQAQSALHRLATFLQQQQQQHPAPESSTSFSHDNDRQQKQQQQKQPHDNSHGQCQSTNHDPPLRVQHGSFAIGNSINSAESGSVNGETTFLPSFVVSGFDFEILKGQVLACCGPVGSGKSTLVQGILGEAVAASPDTVVQTSGSVALVPQTPFILNDTVRENILFGRSFNPIVYDQVIEACCLHPDIKSLGPSRDLTEIGERGVTLSGGQKQRLSLARAAYGKPDLILMDDPLSALDTGTAKLVFKNLIKGPDAFLSESAVLLVTHASHFLNRVDQITVIVQGKNKFLGTWNELLEFQAADNETQRAVDHIRESIQEEHRSDDLDDLAQNDCAKSMAEKKDALMTVEGRENGLSSWATWLLWFKYAGGFYFACMMVLLLTIDRLCYFGQEYWVARWTDGAYESINIFGISFAPQSDGRSAQCKFLAAYAVILALALVVNLMRSEWGVAGGSRAARNVFQAMLSRILWAPMSYFETTPMGRILNRFTYDMEIVDFVLSQNMSLLLVASASYVSGVAVMVGILPWLALSVIPVTVIYVFLLWFYRGTGTDLQRLDALNRSPIQAMVTEAMDGIATIRVFKQESFFLEKYHAAVDKSTSSLLNFVSAQRWLGCRIEMMAAITVFVPTLLVTCWNDHLKLSSGLTGLLIVGSLNFTLALSFLVDFFAEAESAITAIERVDAMSNVPQERDRDTDPKYALDPSWPSCGTLQFNNVSMRYRPGLPLALNGLSFRIPSGKTCGVVGRTGAGKSSLTIALFRLVEIESGSILLDDVNLSSIGLSDVRGRKNGMSIIPQNPFLAGSTIRECLDPFDQSKDAAILDALEAVQLRRPRGRSVLSPGLGLDTPIQEGGSNFSVGERQLLNLARALLHQPRLLCLDEATASIDGATDALIRTMLRTRFPGSTLLTIAHRLHTIMDNDYVLVMEQGKAAEFGAPWALLERKRGLFSQLVDATGPESSRALRAMATRENEQAMGL